MSYCHHLKIKTENKALIMHFNLHLNGCTTAGNIQERSENIVFTLRTKKILDKLTVLVCISVLNYIPLRQLSVVSENKHSTIRIKILFHRKMT